MGAERAALKELAELFRSFATLYAVGGFSRSLLLGVPPHDIDICSKLTLEDVKKLLSNTRFAVSAKSMRLGTARIYADGFSAEYTAFRTDSYPAGSGAHRPESVTFTEDMREDAERRDFTANAVYFDPLTEKFTDFFGGAEDIKRKVLRAVREPDKVFAEDGHRVLRLVRFSAELGFLAEEETFASAKRNARLVLDIAKERVFAELDRIVTADTAYPALGNADGHVRGLALMDALGLSSAGSNSPRSITSLTRAGTPTSRLRCLLPRSDGRRSCTTSASAPRTTRRAICTGMKRWGRNSLSVACSRSGCRRAGRSARRSSSGGIWSTSKGICRTANSGSSSRSTRTLRRISSR